MTLNYTIEELCINNSKLLTSIRTIILTDIYKNEDSIEQTKLVYGLTITSFLVLGLLNNLLCLYTFLSSKKIRITSLGVYLIVYCIFSMITIISTGTDILSILYFDYHVTSNLNDFFSCNFLPVLITSLVHVTLWLSVCVAVERILIESSVILLFGSRQHAFIVFMCLFLIVKLSHIYRIFYRSVTTHPFLQNLKLCKYIPSPSMKIFDDIAEMFYLLGPCLVHVFCTIWLLFRIIKHKLYIQYDIQTTPHQWWSIWKQQICNHKDFWIPPLLIIICILPHVIAFHLLDTCPDSLFRIRLHIILNFFIYIPYIFTFWIYVYPSKIYWEQLLQSKIGILLRYQCCFTETRDRNRNVIS